MEKNSLYEPTGQDSDFGTPLIFCNGLQRSIVKVVFVTEGGEFRTQTTDCGVSRGKKLKGFPSMRGSHTLFEADAKIGRSRMNDRRKAERCCDNRIVK